MHDRQIPNRRPLEHEQVLDVMQQRLIARRTHLAYVGNGRTPLGRSSVDGLDHFLTKTLPRVRTEMSLHVLAYNLKRMLQIFGTQTLVAFLKA